MMKTKMIYMILLFSSILFGGCVRDVIDDVPGDG
jgi:PBP1b-binding outer membrane lipoprotein LpoB